MNFTKITNSHARISLPAGVPDDFGIDSEIGTIRSDTSQISQATDNLVASQIPNDLGIEESKKKDERDQVETVETRYASALAGQVEFKRVQANQIEQRLMKQAQQHTERLSKLKQKPPRIFSLPSTKRRWSSEMRKETNRLRQVEARLASVRDIRDGMGPLIPRLQEIAAAKLRAVQPELVRSRDEARRLERAQIQEGRVEGKREQGHRNSRPRSQELSLTAKA